MKPLRVGLVGLNFGRKRVTSGISGGSLELVACCDHTPALREEFARDFGCETCNSVRQLAERDDIEAILIASPNHFHLEHAWLAASNGKHVFVEKPIANSIAEAQEMIKFCAEKGVKLCVGHNSRFYGCYSTIRRLIEEGRIGRPLAVECHFGASNAFGIQPGDWRRSELTCPGLALIQMGIHLIDTMRTILGEVVSVSAHFENLMVDMPNPDLSALILEFDSGAIGMMVNSYIHNDCFSIWHGSQGVLRYMYWPDEGRIERLDAMGHVDESDHWIEFEKVDSLAYELKDFQTAVREKRAPTVDGEEGLKSLLPVAAAAESARHGVRVRIEELL
jgi:predicted dehydrogenase